MNPRGAALAAQKDRGQAAGSDQELAGETCDVIALPPRDPVFALVPELKLHLSELDGKLVVNPRPPVRPLWRHSRRAGGGSEPK